MNNNRNQNNNRRRGRGNRNQGGGGGNQGNRIDSRARGNAPQMLDKYKKLAQDAQHHGDRVQAEYYLQFADHYFRVIADNRSRQDEPRGDQRARRDERDQDDFDSDFDGAGDFGGDDRRRFESQERDNRGRDSREGQDRDGRENEGREREGRNRQPREARADRPRRDFRRDEQADEAGAGEASEGSAFEPEDNSFVREASEARAERPKRRAPRPRVSNDQDLEGERGGEPVAMPSFLANDAKGTDGFVAKDEAEDAAPRPRRKRSGGGTLSAVG